jgi:hypothetical protein
MSCSKLFLLVLVCAVCCGGCVSAAKNVSYNVPNIDPLMEVAKQKKGYKPLFKKDLSNATLTKDSWAFKDDVLAPTPKPETGPKPKTKSTGPKPMRDIWTKARYGDFIVDLEFKCAADTNSGVFVRCDDVIQWLHTGIEVQIMQEKSDKNARHDTGGVYDCQGPTKDAIKEVGEWNKYTIICNDNWIHVILNGERVNDVDLDLWTKAHKNPDGSPNKFNIAYKEMAREGHVGLQFHGNPVWFRNMRIKDLK